jgi:fructokinase
VIGSPHPPLFIGCGEVLWDLLPSGRMPGGAPANFVYHAHALGNVALLLSRVGADAAGDELLLTLRGKGFDTAWVQRDREHATGTATVDLATGQPSYRFEADSAWDHLALDPTVVEALAQASVFCFGTLALRTAAAREVLHAAIRHLPAGCIRLCDLNLRPPHVSMAAVTAALDAATVVKLSQNELEALGTLFEAPEPLVWLFEHRPIELVAITRGARGSKLASRTEVVEHPGFPVSGRGDPIGAGDAFAAALTHHLIRGRPLRRANELAALYAAHVASHTGAMPDVPEPVRALACGELR